MFVRYPPILLPPIYGESVEIEGSEELKTRTYSRYMGKVEEKRKDLGC